MSIATPLVRQRGDARIHARIKPDTNLSPEKRILVRKPAQPDTSP
jgi:hypothetical protein